MEKKDGAIFRAQLIKADRTSDTSKSTNSITLPRNSRNVKRYRLYRKTHNRLK